MNKIVINAEKLVNCVSEDDIKKYGLKRDEQEVIQISEEILSINRWSYYEEYIYKIKDKYYRFNRSVGATEMQDTDSWAEDFVGWIDVEGVEVKKEKVMVEKWVEV